jgi:hypothetical protein
LSASASSIAYVGHTASASADLETDVAVTIISGPATGSFHPCFTGGADSVLGSAGVSGFLGGFGGSSGGQGPFGNCNAQTVGGDPYTLGVTQILPFSISASASSAGAFNPSAPAQANASVEFSTLAVFDSSGNPVPNAAFTITEAVVPEPTPGVFIFCGAALLFVARRRFARI